METQSSAAPPASGPRPGSRSPGLAEVAVLLVRAQDAAGLGGLRGLESAFGRAGLADRFSSWVAVGPNLPVSAAEIERAIGPSVEAMATAGRADPDRLAASLAELLPRVIDGLTPEGRMPASRLGALWGLGRMLLGTRRPGAA